VSKSTFKCRFYSVNIRVKVFIVSGWQETEIYVILGIYQQGRQLSQFSVLPR
jgi:hypothetical protein